MKNPIIVQPIHSLDSESWTPFVGEETLNFLSASVPESSREIVSKEAISILTKCVSPFSDRNNSVTGLVVGYVQSGKTMSYEAVAALARDNGFDMIVVITGISNLLLGQTTTRLSHDLGIENPNRPRRWRLFENPSADPNTIKEFNDLLQNRRDRNLLEKFKKTILVTILKHPTHIQNLTTLVNNLTVPDRVSTLIVDDEADQASLNIEISNNTESATYRSLMDLRQSLSNHSYLQYTATPQAPLLISILDSLSPKFVQVLTPGQEYIGGRDFFCDSSRVVRNIPNSDLPTKDNILTEPPTSLIEAIRVFLVGTAVGLMRDGDLDNRSMLVHPSHLTIEHGKYSTWAHNIINQWTEVFNLPDGDPDKKELIEDFRPAFEDLKKTVGSNLPKFEELCDFLRNALRNTRVLEVNSIQGNTPKVDWQNIYGWILVGGQAMDRGFTVNGLTVTYMPRKIGIGNADTVQQRARFFGYKRSYFDFCRVYLEDDVLHAFEVYVNHEEDMRTQLLQIQDSGLPLSDWKRAFILDSELQPCRRQVLKFEYMRGNFSNDWFFPRKVFSSAEVNESNKQVVTDFLRKLSFKMNQGHPDRSNFQRHSVCENVPLQSVIEQLLLKIRIPAKSDSDKNVGLLLQLRRVLQNNPEEKCTIFIMSPNAQREREINEFDQIPELFQGKSVGTKVAKTGEVYPGDRDIRDKFNVTIQIHNLNLKRKSHNDSIKIIPQVHVIAVWVPQRFEEDWLVQEQM